MMRALAGVSAAAVALIALPTTVGVAAETDTAESAAAAVAPTSSGIANFLAEPSVFGLNMGAFLWLSVAFVAAAVSVVAVGRSRAHGVLPVDASDFRADFGYRAPATSAPVAPVQVSSVTRSAMSMGPSFAVADSTQPGR